jgi:hypothetical protein
MLFTSKYIHGDSKLLSCFPCPINGNPDNTLESSCTLKDMWHLGRQMSHLSVQTKLDSVFKLHHYVQKQVQLLSLLWINKCIIYLQFLNKGCTVIFLYFIFISTTYIIKISFYLCSKIFLSFRATFCFTNPDYILIPTTFSLNYSGLSRVY